VELIYNKFKNAAVQNLTDELFLPVEAVPSGKVKSAPVDYIYDPTRKR